MPSLGEFYGPEREQKALHTVHKHYHKLDLSIVLEPIFFPKEAYLKYMKAHNKP